MEISPAATSFRDIFFDSNDFEYFSKCFQHITPPVSYMQKILTNFNILVTCFNYITEKVFILQINTSRLIRMIRPFNIAFIEYYIFS